MGWDVKATADGAVDAIGKLPSLADVSAGIPTLEQLAPYSNAFMILGIVAVASAVLFMTKFGERLRNVVNEIFFTNWQLAVLGSAALLLSMAGGWTTWDGMRNFTGESVLSAMFTFGIHGVMLIVAWLIGESFATGMNQMRGRYGRSVSAPMVALTLIGGALLVGAAAIAVIRYGMSNDQVLYGAAAAGALFLAVALLMMFSKSDVIQPYAQGVRIITKNAMLWVMFLACMSTSVFFSFDSRFNVIFPKDQRERAAEIRTKKQVSAVVADIGDTISARRISEAELLFNSDGWKAYEGQLAALSKASEGAEAEIEKHFTDQMEAFRASIAEQHERIATATSSQAGLSGKKTILTDELSRLKAERPTLAAELATKKTELDARAKEVDAKRVEAMAEDKGVEGSLKEGKGPIYRERMAEMGKLKEYYKIGEERVKDAQKRLDVGDQRISQIEAELAGIDGELAKLQGEADTANQRIKAAENSQLADDEGQKIDPARVRAAFEKSRAEFRQKPDAEHLASLHGQCVQLYDAMISAEATKERVRGIDCDPKQATEAAATLFALNTGLKAFETNCAGGDKVPETGGVDPLLNFGRKCLQDSGLASKDTSEMGARLSAIDLNRDDKAHNFVVSLNAFQDGNRLAYLALAIAIGIDSLIFMSGLFGANAVRSPLSDVPTMKARNSQQLNAMIETALLPDVFKKARLVAQSMHPIENVDGYSNEVRLDELDPETAVQVRDVLNAGAIIGAVRRADQDGRYLVRSELLEFLNTVIKRQLETNGEDAKRSMQLDQLEDQVRVALMPAIGETCEYVMGQLDPINETDGFTSEVYLDQIPAEKQPPMLNVLNTGATFQVVQRDSKNAERYYVHKDLYKTLARIRAAEFARSGALLPRLGAPPRAPSFGGTLTEDRRAIVDHTRGGASIAKGVAAGPVADPHRQLVSALGVDPETYLDLTGEAFGEAAAASEAFQRVRSQSAHLDKALGDRDDEALEALDRAFERLEDSITRHDERGLLPLKNAETDIKQNWAVLMLLPGGPYEIALNAIVDSLEAANANDELTSDEMRLLLIARRLREALAASPRRTKNDWIKLQSDLAMAGRDEPANIAMGNGKRLMN